MHKKKCAKRLRLSETMESQIPQDITAVTAEGGLATTHPQNPSHVNSYMTATDLSGFTWDEALPILQAQFAPLPSQQPHLTDSCKGTAMMPPAQQLYPDLPASTA